MKRENTLFFAVTVEEKGECQRRGVAFMSAPENGITLLLLTHRDQALSPSV